MFTPPVSAAMDATAASGGPSTILPQIITGSPEQILQQAEHVLSQVSKFVQLVEQLEQAGQQLSGAWSGGASESAAKKLSDTVESFNKIIKVMQEGAALLNVSAGMVQTAQTGYTSVVSAVNPTVAGLMSNPWTYGAAVALSTGTSSALRGFVMGVEGMMTALGTGKFATQVMALVQLITEIENLLQGGGAAGAGGSTPAPTSAPVTAPSAPPPVATQSGLSAIGAMGGTNGTGGTGATSAYGTNPYSAAPTGAYGATPYGSSPYGTPTVPAPSAAPTIGATSTGAGAADSWIPVDPAASTSVHAGAPTPAGPGAGDTGSGTVTVGARDGQVEAFVEVPSGHDVNVNLDMTVDGHHVTESAHVAADGTVTVDHTGNGQG